MHRFARGLEGVGTLPPIEQIPYRAPLPSAPLGKRRYALLVEYISDGTKAQAALVHLPHASEKLAFSFGGRSRDAPAACSGLCGLLYSGSIVMRHIGQGFH